MTTEEVLLEKFKVLPPNLKQGAIDFVVSCKVKLFQNREKEFQRCFVAFETQNNPRRHSESQKRDVARLPM